MRDQQRTRENQPTSLSSLPRSVLEVIAGHLSDAIDALPENDPDEVVEEQEELFDQLFHDWYIPDDPYDWWDIEDESMGSEDQCDGYCCFPPTETASSSHHRFARSWDPEPIQCNRCKPEDPWIQIGQKWIGNYNDCQTVSVSIHSRPTQLIPYTVYHPLHQGPCAHCRSLSYRD